MNGYCQIELGGELRGLKFNMHSIEIISRADYEYISDDKGNVEAKLKAKEDTSFAAIVKFVYAGLCGNAFAKSGGIETICQEKKEDIAEWVEDLFFSDKKASFIKSVMEAYWSSKPMQKVIEDSKDEVKKKKR
jgi:hypothetical protein